MSQLPGGSDRVGPEPSVPAARAGGQAAGCPIGRRRRVAACTRRQGDRRRAMIGRGRQLSEAAVLAQNTQPTLDGTQAIAAHSPVLGDRNRQLLPESAGYDSDAAIRERADRDLRVTGASTSPLPGPQPRAPRPEPSKPRGTVTDPESAPCPGRSPPTPPRPPSRPQVPGLVATRPLRGRPARPARRVPPPLRRRLHAGRRRQRPVRDAVRPGGRPRGLPRRPGRAPLGRGQRALHRHRRPALGPGARRGPARHGSAASWSRPSRASGCGRSSTPCGSRRWRPCGPGRSARRSPPCRRCGGSPCGSSSARRWAWPPARRWTASSARSRRSCPTAGSGTPWCS